MCDTCTDRIEIVAHEIEEHLGANLGAAETVQGILTWWIGQQRFIEAEQTVEAALVRLVEQGRVVRRQPAAGGQAIYQAVERPDDG